MPIRVHPLNALTCALLVTMAFTAATGAKATACSNTEFELPGFDLEASVVDFGSGVSLVAWLHQDRAGAPHMAQLRLLDWDGQPAAGWDENGVAWDTYFATRLFVCGLPTGT